MTTAICELRVETPSDNLTFPDDLLAEIAGLVGMPTSSSLFAACEAICVRHIRIHLARHGFDTRVFVDVWEPYHGCLAWLPRGLTAGEFSAITAPGYSGMAEPGWDEPDEHVWRMLGPRAFRAGTKADRLEAIRSGVRRVPGAWCPRCALWVCVCR